MSAKLTIAEAYRVLDLEEGAPLDVVKSTYKQLALRTHPDKNPNDPDATEQFQRVGAAYHRIVRHFERPESTYYDGEDDDGYDYDYDSDDYEDLHDLGFFIHMFHFMSQNRGHRFYFDPRAARKVPKQRQETEKEFQERLRKSREEQIAAQERRREEAVARKLRAEQDREREREAAERRQKAKIESKRAAAESLRKKKAEALRTQQQQTQALRSNVFAAARSGDREKVKRGIWEDGVDASGGEIKPGCNCFVDTPPEDEQETLLHIAARKGDVELLAWLDAHNAEPDERNAQDMTPFHVSVKAGYIPIINHFLENYPPKDVDSASIYRSPESTSVLSLALESQDPQTVYLVLEHGLANQQDIRDAWPYINCSTATKSPSQKAEDIRKLLIKYGHFDAAELSTAPIEPEQTQLPSQGSNDVQSRAKLSGEQGPRPVDPERRVDGRPQLPPDAAFRGRTRGRGRGRGRARGVPATHR